MAGKTETTPGEIAGFDQLELMSKGLPENEATESQLGDIKDDAFQFRKLTIDPELEVLIPKLTDSAYKGLQEEIKNHGCRDPVIVWKGHDIILDGHHRYKICTEFNIPFDIEEYEFANRTEVKIWMITNQNARRNLNTSQRAMQAGKLAALYSEKAKARQGTRTDLGQELDESERGNSNKKAAEEMGVSPQSVAYAIKILKKGIPELIELAESGKIAVSAGAKVAGLPPEDQKMVVEEAIDQIQEGKRPKIEDILQELAPFIEDNEEKIAVESESTIEEKKEPTDNQEILDGTEITNRPEVLAEKELESNEDEGKKAFEEYCDRWNVPLENRSSLWENKLKHDEEEGNACACNIWGGPWVCTHCQAWWETINVEHFPVACPGCGKGDGIKRQIDVKDWHLL